MDNIKTFDELLPVLKMIKENEPNMHIRLTGAVTEHLKLMEVLRKS